MFTDDESVRFLQDPDVTNKFSNCKTLSDVKASDYDAVFYPGGRLSISDLAEAFSNRCCRRFAGHGPVIDLPDDSINAKLASDVRLPSILTYFWVPC